MKNNIFGALLHAEGGASEGALGGIGAFLEEVVYHGIMKSM